MGHLVGALDNYVSLQNEHDCFYCVVDWHALTSMYADTSRLQEYVLEVVAGYLAAGVSPEESALFVQSDVKEHAELHLLLSMLTPLGWLERVPTYKEKKTQMDDKDLSNYGFLGYPVLQTADIILYKADLVPVGEDQVVHVELTREVARRFNHIYGREPDFEEKAEQAAELVGPERRLLVKICGRTILHKTEAGGVRVLDLSAVEDPAEAIFAAAAEVAAAVVASGEAEGIEGILACEFVAHRANQPGQEVLADSRRPAVARNPDPDTHATSAGSS